jgi:hypothetical protein
MTTQDENRHPDEIENDIERTRARVSSTIDAIQDKLTPGQMMDQVYAYARTSLPADFGANLGNTIRDNPVPVALIGVGVAWLMMQGPQSDGRARMRHRLAEYGADINGPAYRRDSDDSDSEDSTVGRVIRKAGAKAHDLKDQAREVAHNLTDKASEFGQRLSEGASSMAGHARETMSSTREGMAGSVGDVGARASELGKRSEERYYRTKDKINRKLDDQPLLLGALGVAIGTLLGAALPITRREDRFMGSTRDSLMEGAMEVARQKAGHVKESVQRAARAAQEEVSTSDTSAGRRQGKEDANADSTEIPDPSRAGGTPGQSLH